MAICLTAARGRLILPTMTPSVRGRVPLRIIFSVATALGFFSAFAAFYFVSTFTDKPAAFGLLLTLNLGYWYSWAVLTPAHPVADARASRSIARRGRWRSRFTSPASSSPRRCTWCSPSRCAWAPTGSIGESLDTWLHEAQEMLFLNFDWEMMTYWTIVGVGTALKYHARSARARS